MTDTKHTPGPWRREHSDETGNTGIYGDGEHCRIAVLEDYTDGVDKKQRREMEERQAHNARLIAAAPELLAALEAMLRGADPTFMPEVPRGERTVSLARAAIARAKGEKS